MAQALTGTYREEHLFELKLAYEAWQFTLGQIDKVDGQNALQLGRMKCDRTLPPLKPKARPKRRPNSPRFDVRAALYYVVGLDLTEIEGVSELTARPHRCRDKGGEERSGGDAPEGRRTSGEQPVRQGSGAGRGESARRGEPEIEVTSPH
jgi:hypothetical protein